MATPQSQDESSAHVDFLVIGAGISGIGAARHLRQRWPERRFAVLEAMDGFGGTWWTHRYPGARSDSDLYTYGYAFKPWMGSAIATADEIRRYLAETIAENGLAPHIRYGHRVLSADWSSRDSRWTLRIARQGQDGVLTLTAGFLWMCAGYYDHGQPYTPSWPGLDSFQGRVVHPQHWPQDLDCTGQRVVVVGSGATAATLIPALAEQVAHVTMLQRSPTFFAALPRAHPLEAPLRALDLPADWTHEILRRAHIARNGEVVRMSFERPEELRANLIEQARSQLPEGFDVDRHFNPRYRPWQQRVAVVPDGDLFAAIRGGKASVVTDGIECFDASGIRLASGTHLPADVVVTATGFDLQVLGGVPFAIDGRPVNFTERVTWRGVMLEGLPNLAYVMGYFRSSWTLRLDLVCELVCRVLEHMRTQGHAVVEPRLRPEDTGMPRLPWMDPQNFNAGYILRAQHRMFRQGDRDPWQHNLEYQDERNLLPAVRADDSALAYR
ncbi:flavin-containing monooxygenase [Pseudorhodoferax sp.]|uniref:flavin-containing monooxygenase n=1 Tax=Pseudorhodoferax sp. TaxID=1993553 RepID=UPI002DD61A65|nr:NAD(P)/FAD-dependent oxidoreductase [Pseudorhodoferax sp.]